MVYGLQEFGCQVDVFDPKADPEEVEKEYGVTSIQDLSKLSLGVYDAIVLAVAHKEFTKLDIAQFKDGDAVVYDIKGILPKALVDGRL